MRVMIIGVAGSIGHLTAERLVQDPAIDTVIGLDAHACRPPIPGLRFVRAHLRQPEWTAMLRDVDVALILSGLSGWLADHAATKEAVADAKAVFRAVSCVPKVIVACSAMVYGPQPPSPILETAPVRGHQTNPTARALAMMSDFLDVLDYGGVLTRLRAAWVSGPHHLALARYLAHHPVLACGYADHAVQMVHEDDLVEAFRLAILRDLPGIYNVAADGGITIRDLAALVGQGQQTCRPLEWLVQRARLRRTTIPAGGVRALYQGGVVDSGKFKVAGWTPRHTTHETIAAAVEMARADV